eukprot:CAMPEP_0204564626 /NCGR_PEP_ID=MMETSP0661-20131031/34999_1 /ASSEMBLY_ACC=CAM_ASM_000606 /TAXON_ID=109239 /ORGANISM="Alexandrium margalefi, Strain AMGDE01CS-322" /LENGTH=34 /DNA_ID= /DNA_START= /DNA_END= /DNA_ORIENTATION=
MDTIQLTWSGCIAACAECGLAEGGRSQRGVLSHE